MKSRALLLLCSFFFCAESFAATPLPKNLSASDRQKVLELLGFGSQAKLLSSPVPLGGYQGFEVGLSTEYIPIQDISGLGSGSNARGDLNFLNLTLGKGLAYNVDTFFQLTPLPQPEGLFGYGAVLRWGFHEFRRFPGILSLVVHGSGANYSNLLNVRTTGADVVMTVAIEEASLYFGTGTIRTIGTFLGGGTNGITVEGTTEDSDLSDVHTVFGLSLAFSEIMLTFEVDRVVQSVYGGRVSYRF